MESVLCSSCANRILTASTYYDRDKKKNVSCYEIECTPVQPAQSGFIENY